MQSFRSMKSSRTDDYDSIHGKWEFDLVPQTGNDNSP